MNNQDSPENNMNSHDDE